MNEDFVSYDLAVKLKDKGFDWKTRCGYLPPMPFIHEVFCDTDWSAKKGCSAPTISQVLKWLREKKGLHIEVRFDSRGFGACINKYDLKTLEHISFNPLLYHGFFKTYEEAAIDGIEYILDNLI